MPRSPDPCRGGAVPILLATALALLPANVSAQSWREITQSRRVSGETALDVHVQYGAGRFEVRPGDDATLYRLHLRYDEDQFTPVTRYTGGSLRIGMEGRDNRVQPRRGETGAELILSLPRRVPTDLRMEFGAVRARMDLGGVPLRSLHLSTGASESSIRISEPNSLSMERVRMEVGAASFDARDLGNLNASRIEVEAAVGDVTLDFGGSWAQDAAVSVKMGLGALALHFPAEVGVRVEKRGFLASMSAPGLEQRGDAWFSPGYDGAARKVTVDIEAALGSIEVRWGG
jgi:hypothetical protein